MTKQDQDIIVRFNIIFRSTALEKAEFAHYLEITHTYLNKFLKGNAKVELITKRLFELGYSIDWLYSGDGDMVRDRKSPDSYDFVRELDPDEQIERIYFWIEQNFNTVERFEKFVGLDIGFVDYAVGTPYIYDLMKYLKRWGMSLEWSITGEGSMYTINENGKKLRRNGTKGKLK